MDVLTDRLRLRPLTAEAAGRIVAGTPGPGERWHAQYPVPGELRPLAALAASEPDPVFTMYVILAGPEAIAVGGIGFRGRPGDDGVVTVGYGLVEAVRGRGYATEALVALTAHALAHGARRVAADTELQNAPSQRVLVRAGFREVARTELLVSYLHP